MQQVVAFPSKFRIQEEKEEEEERDQFDRWVLGARANAGLVHGSASSAIDGDCHKSPRHAISLVGRPHDALMFIARRSWCSTHTNSMARRCYSASSMEKRDYAVSQICKQL